MTRKLIVLLLHDYRCRDLWSAVWSHGNNQMLRETQTSWQLPGSRGVGPSPVPSSGWAEHGCCMISRSSCTILETVGTDQPPHRLGTGTIKQNCLQLNTSHCSNSTTTFPALKWTAGPRSRKIRGMYTRHVEIGNKVITASIIFSIRIWCSQGKWSFMCMWLSGYNVGRCASTRYSTANPVLNVPVLII